MIAAWGLLLVLTFSANGTMERHFTASQSVMYFPTKDQCEAGAALVKETIPGNWRHVCVPMEGRAR